MAAAAAVRVTVCHSFTQLLTAQQLACIFIRLVLFLPSSDRHWFHLGLLQSAGEAEEHGPVLGQRGAGGVQRVERLPTNEVRSRAGSTDRARADRDQAVSTETGRCPTLLQSFLRQQSAAFSKRRSRVIAPAPSPTRACPFRWRLRC